MTPIGPGQGRGRERWIQFLLGAVAATACFGLAMVLVPDAIERFFNWLIFGSGESPDSFSSEAADYNRFVYGVLGAVMAGWMVLIGLVAAGPLRSGEQWAWKAVAGSLAFWFAVDTSFSLASGYPENAAFNVIFGIAVGAPLAALRPRRDSALGA